MPFERLSQVFKKLKDSKSNEEWRGTVMGRVRSADDKYWIYVCHHSITGAYFLASERELEKRAT